MANEREAEIFRNDCEAMLASPHGRRLLLRILMQSGIWHPAHGLEERHLAYAEGRRSLGLEVLDWFTAVNPGAFMHILAEGLPSRRQKGEQRGAEYGFDEDN